MNEIRHGTILPLETPSEASIDVDSSGSDSPLRCAGSRWPFWYMFPELQGNLGYLLEESKATVDSLRTLGRDGMRDAPIAQIPDVSVPAIYTFLGQFIDHDIVQEKGSSEIGIDQPKPIALNQVRKKIFNVRSPNLDLDHVYGPDVEGQLAPRDPQDPNKLSLGMVRQTTIGPVSGKDAYNDLPRGTDGKAMIGDQRDDENIVIAQLHVAFIRVHNNLVEQGYRFEAARKLLTQHYQWVVLDDFLERVADPEIVKRVRYYGPRFFNPSPRTFYLPLEFSVAAFRFGHSKVRPSYDFFNCIHLGAELGLLFSNAGQRLAEDWVIDWSAFLSTEDRRILPRPIDTALTPLLLELGSGQIGNAEHERNLAVRNLLRGYVLRMPTGQAVAQAMSSQGIDPLTEKQLESVAREVSKEQVAILKASKFLTRTPLWFYILAEAAYYNRGYHLGPVGSTIVAEVLIGVLRNSTYSILADPQWRPTLGENPAKFDIQDLLKLAHVI